MVCVQCSVIVVARRCETLTPYQNIPTNFYVSLDNSCFSDVLSMETKSDRFFLGPRFGKRHQESPLNNRKGDIN